MTDDTATETPPEAPDGPAGDTTPAAGRKPSKRSTNAVVSQRVEQVLQLRIAGGTLPDIRDFAARQSPPWGVSDSMLKKYIQQANDLLKERAERSAVRSHRMHVARREFLYGFALKANDIRAALAALQDMAKLEGHYDDLQKLNKELDELARIVREKTAAFGDTTPPPTPETSLEHRDADPAV